jgi:hypothetical protein
MKTVSPDTLNTSIMHLSVREVRMIVERILLSLRIPEGFVPAVRDCILYSQAEGLGGLAMLKRDMDRLRNANPAAMSVSTGMSDAVLDAAQQHAWIAAPSLLDLALASFRTVGNAVIVASNVHEMQELLVLRGTAGRFGARVELTAADGRMTLRVLEDGLLDADTVMTRLLADGTPVPRPLWEDLYARSHDALTPDSIESRRHAGPVMVDAQGRVHGRDDDDTDFSLLGVSPPNPASGTA